jgi:cysteinyl-tRNA synthetase
MLSRLYDARDIAESMRGEEDADRVAADLGEDAQQALELGRAFPERFLAALGDDFNTSKALAHLFTLARAVNRFAGHKKAIKRGAPVVAPALAAIELVGESLGLMTTPTAGFVEEVKRKRLAALGLSRGDVEAAVAQRQVHRDAKEWAESDAIRDRLAGQGVLVMDTPEGPRWRLQLTAD